MAVAAVLLVGADDRLALKSPYNPDLVQALKDAVPYGYREWDSAAKVWRIDPDWGDVVLHALTSIGVTVVDKRPATPPPTVGRAGAPGGLRTALYHARCAVGRGGSGL
jgi:hypothetical protein